MILTPSSGIRSTENPFCSRLPAEPALAANKRAKDSLARRAIFINTLLHAWVRPATVRALGATKSTHSSKGQITAPEPQGSSHNGQRPTRRALTQGRCRGGAVGRGGCTSDAHAAIRTWPTRARSRTTSRRTRGSRARRAFLSCSRDTPTAAASPSPCFPRDVRTQQSL